MGENKFAKRKKRSRKKWIKRTLRQKNKWGRFHAKEKMNEKHLNSSFS